MKTFYVTVDIYITANSLKEAEILANERLGKIADKEQDHPYDITDSGRCEDDGEEPENDKE